MIKRRKILKVTAASTAATILSMPSLARAQVNQIEVALIAPLSGPYAHQGKLMLDGAELAISDINSSGGIKNLGGASLQLVVVDAGDTVETASNAAQRMISDHPALIGVTGAWLSSFTLSVSEVTERSGIPMITESYSDQITSRGFKYIFQTAPTASDMVNKSIPEIVQLATSVTGKKPSTTGIIIDNSAAFVSVDKALRENVIPSLGLTLKFNEIFTPSLADATSLIQAVRENRPDFVILAASTVADSKLLLQTFDEFGLGGGHIPIVSNGGAMAAPTLLKLVGQQALEGLMVIVANWGHRGQEQLISRFMSSTGEPWMGQDSINTYGDIQLFRYALETAKSVDRQAIVSALHAIDTGSGPATYYSGGIQFDAAGRNQRAVPMVIQWQKGIPVPIYPNFEALAKPIWST